MTSPELERLAELGGLKRESASQREYVGLLQSGNARLADAANADLSPESRFDLAYNAAHALALAALRRMGYRSPSRQLVFQTLPHTTDLPPSVWRMLSTCHGKRNLAEYEGYATVDRPLLDGLLDAAQALSAAVSDLPAPTEESD